MPAASASNQVQTVSVRREDLTIPTHLPAAPDTHPMFLEKRVYQGSSGRIYPLPATDRISEAKTDRKWKAVWIENEFLRVLILPEIGGRIHAILDKTSGYDLIYNQPIIKPALVGLAGPWISGGIELNWPQHHRPATFLPVEVEIEEHADGSKTVWCSDHDPMCRMKGMHGICLHPGRAFVELKVRAYNRTPFTQTFLWWANVATRVHEAYQSFFPPDVYYVADHARRSMSEYPLCRGFYYGVNYGERGRKGVPENEIPGQFVPPHCAGGDTVANDAQGACAVPHYAPNDLSFYANIPTPCSYMCMGSQEDFFGGYDYKAQAGIVHIANHHVSPGKKQWTWGNHAFGYAWDRNLTEAGADGKFAPYIEIMAGVYTDNQPDFSFLAPGETKTWSQYWYPIQKIGPARHANLRAAVSLNMDEGTVRAGVSVTQTWHGAKIELMANGRTFFSVTRDLTPGEPFVEAVSLFDSKKAARGNGAPPSAGRGRTVPGISETSNGKIEPDNLAIRVTDSEGREIISYRVKPRVKGLVPPPATEPPPPEKIASADELYVTGLHLEQYRHATRCPTLYWREALRRDPLDSRCNNAMGLWHLRRGELAEAEAAFRRAIERVTRRNANPGDGEPYYNLGLCLRYQMDRGGNGKKALVKNPPAGNHGEIGPGLPTPSPKYDEAYAAFYKATWNQAWAAAGYHALAEMDCRRRDWNAALDHLDRSLRFDTDNLRARDLKAIVLRALNQDDAADALLRETLALDPLDWWARHLSGGPLGCDLQTRLDLAHDFARAGFYSNAIELLRDASVERGDLPDQSWGAMPMVLYTLGWLFAKNGDTKSAVSHYRRAAAEPPDYCFPSRLEEILVLESAMAANPPDARAPYYLGNLLYDRRRHEEAIQLWEKSARLDPSFSIAWRNLGIGYFNISRKSAKARAAYDRAFATNRRSARVLFERDQLWKRLGESPARRLRELEKYPELTAQRDDLSVELCVLYNQTGCHNQALEILRHRRFQPWEGGEGQALGQYVQAHLALGRLALAKDNPAQARLLFEQALAAPENLGEARHILANGSDIQYWLGVACHRLGDAEAARRYWRAAANFKGDFQEMRVAAFSEMTFYSALAREKLGQAAAAKKLFRQLLVHARALAKAEAKMDYFATSLPTMLLFEDDLPFRQKTTALFLEAQAQFGLRAGAKAKNLLRLVLRRDPNHVAAASLLQEMALAQDE